MFKPSDTIVAALRDLYACLGAIECGRAATLNLALDAELTRRRPDITGALLAAAQAASQHGLKLGAELTAACCRAGCILLGERHPGPSIEVRVPPGLCRPDWLRERPETHAGNSSQRRGDATTSVH